VAFFATLVLLLQCNKDNPAPNIQIPDNNFRNALIELGVDTDGDGKISSQEAEKIVSLDVSYKKISDI